jgi:hypothetical protein
VTSEEALVSAVLHVVGKSRAFILEIGGAIEEIGSLHNDRADLLVEAMRVALREPAGPGTLRHVERAATELLRSLRR